MEREIVVIGAGISGLTAAALLAKKGFFVTVIDAQFKPGGSCGIFKRRDVIFEQGCAMIYGFGERGFNPHRFVFNILVRTNRYNKTSFKGLKIYYKFVNTIFNNGGVIESIKNESPTLENVFLNLTGKRLKN